MRALTYFALLGALMTSRLSFAELASGSAWIRLLPPNVTTTAAYAELTSDRADKVIAVSSEQVDRIEIHESSMQDGVMSMRPIDTLSLQKGQALSLSPNGKHLMLIGLKRPLVEGETLSLVFELEAAGQVPVEFVVRRP